MSAADRAEAYRRCLENIWQLGYVTMATEVGRDMIMRAIEEALWPVKRMGEEGRDADSSFIAD